MLSGLSVCQFRASRDSGAPAVGYYQAFLSLNFGPRGILGLQRCWVLPDLFIAYGKAVWTACTLDFSWDTPWWLSLAGLPGTCLGSSWACFGPCAASWKHWAQNTTIFGSVGNQPREAKSHQILQKTTQNQHVQFEVWTENHHQNT